MFCVFPFKCSYITFYIENRIALLSIKDALIVVACVSRAAAVTDVHSFCRAHLIVCVCVCDVYVC